MRVSETVFFKHKYLTMPTITPEAALLKAVDDLKNAIEGKIPPSLQTKEGVKQLMKIFKGYATESTDHTAKTDTIREDAAEQRLSSNTETTADAAPEQRVHTSVPPQQHRVQTTEAHPAAFVPSSQEIKDDCPAADTRARSSVRTITQ